MKIRSAYVVKFDGTDFRNDTLLCFSEENVYFANYISDTLENAIMGYTESKNLLDFLYNYKTFSEGMTAFVKKRLSFDYIKDEDVYVASLFITGGWECKIMEDLYLLFDNFTHVQIEKREVDSLWKNFLQ